MTNSELNESQSGPPSLLRSFFGRLSEAIRPCFSSVLFPASIAAPSSSPAREGKVAPKTAELRNCTALACKALLQEIDDLKRDPPEYVSRIGNLSVPSFVCDDKFELERPTGDGPWDFSVAICGGYSDAEKRAYDERIAELPDLRLKAQQIGTTLGTVKKTLQEARKRLERLEQDAREDSGASGDSESISNPLETAAAAVQAAEAEVKDVTRQEKEVSEAIQAIEEKKKRQELVDAYDFPFLVGLSFDERWPAMPPTQVHFRGVFHHALTDEEECLPPAFFRNLPKEDGVYTLRGVLEAIHTFLVDPSKAWGLKEDAIPKRFFESTRSYAQQNQQRINTIRKYRKQCKHPELFQDPPRWKQEWFTPKFWSAYTENTEEAWRSILQEHLKGEIFSFKIFTDKFCNLLVEEIFNFYASGLPARRPNSMNNYGIILNEIGLEPMIDELVRILQPLGDLLFPGPGSDWDGHHCFIVRYREGEDLGLDMHTDDSDVTFNICLGLNFDGAGLQFCGVMGDGNHRHHTYTYKHAKGTCVFHLGRKRHGADDITSGERLNLILWTHSSTYRNSNEYRDPPYAKEDGPPDAVCVSYTHDRDFGNFKKYPVGKEHFQGRGWCPPKQFQYEDFKPDCEKEKACCSCQH